MVGRQLRGCFPWLFSAHSEEKWKTLAVETVRTGNKVVLSYQVLEKAGRGTFGVVFKVRTNANEILAMKRIEHKSGYKCREILIMKALGHLNVISLHYFCTQKRYSKFRDTLFMEFLPESLHEYISRRRKAKAPLKPIIVCCFTYQLSRGLAHLHHRGIAHRDIKPRNLLVDSSNNVLKICDLGSAKRLDDQERNITYICSRWYRAPELLFASTNYTVAIDMWSAGCCLAQMIRLEPLFKGKNTTDQISKIFQTLGSPSRVDIENLSMLSNLLPDESLRRAPTEEILIHDYSDSIERLLFKLLEYDPKKRPTAWALLSDEYFDQLRRVDQPGAAEKEALPELFNFTQEELAYPPAGSRIRNWEDSSSESDSDRGSSSPCSE